MKRINEKKKNDQFDKKNKKRICQEKNVSLACQGMTTLKVWLRKVRQTTVYHYKYKLRRPNSVIVVSP